MARQASIRGEFSVPLSERSEIKAQGLPRGFPIKIKNTFLDDWEDADIEQHKQNCRRQFRSCPALPEDNVQDEPAVDTSFQDVRKPCDCSTGKQGIDVMTCQIRGAQPDQASAMSTRDAEATRSSSLCASAPAQAPLKTLKRMRNARLPNMIRCTFFMHEGMHAAHFDIKRHICGVNGMALRDLSNATDVNIYFEDRDIIRGSCGTDTHRSFVLIVEGFDSDAGRFKLAIKSVVGILRCVEDRYASISRLMTRAARSGPMFWVGDLSYISRMFLGSIFDTLGVFVSEVSPAMIAC